jgi:ligand-binding sensor domain-containing protein
MWLGTTSALWRFDGVHFVSWIPPEGQQLSSSGISSLLGTPDGSLWIGTAVGLSLWKDSHLTNYLVDQRVVNQSIALLHPPDGGINSLGRGREPGSRSLRSSTSRLVEGLVFPLEKPLLRAY